MADFQRRRKSSVAVVDDTDDLGAFDRIEAEAHPECVEWVTDRIANQLRLPAERVTATHKATITSFLVGDEKKRTLFVNMIAPEQKTGADGQPIPEDELEAEVSVNIGHPYLQSRDSFTGMNEDVLYFVRMDPKKDITPENIEVMVTWGVSRGGKMMDTFLRTMQFVLAPTLLRNKTWPDSIHKDFNNVIHKFMATLTENVNRLKGSTVLYVPIENLTEDQLQDSHNDKELVQRFESAVIHWTRQIKEVVNEKDVEAASESEGPLAEIEYWRARTRDLTNIRQQFIREDVLQIVDVLQRAKSFYYLEPFLALRTDIETQTNEAIDNLKYLNTLKEPCTRLGQADVKEIPGMVKEILQTVQMIFIHSTYYNKDRFYRLLRMISNEIVLRCRKKINLQAIFEGDVERSMVALQESVEAGEAWMTACRKMLIATAEKLRGTEHKGDQLEVDESIFNEIDGFVKHRCMNLQEVCKGQLQFGFKVHQPMAIEEGGKERDPSEEYRGVLPCFGGAKGPEIESQLLDIQRGFKAKMDVLRKLNYDILDVKATRWSDDFRVLKGELDNLSTMMTQIIQSAFDLVATVEGGAELLEAFFYLAKRDELERAVDKRKDDVIRLFAAEVTFAQKETTRYHGTKVPPILWLHPPKAGHAFWARSFTQRIEGSHSLLHKCWYLSSSVEKEEAMSNYQKTVKSIDEIVKREARNWKDALPDNPAMYLEVPLIAKREDQGDVTTLAVNFAPELSILFSEVRYWQRLGEAIPAHVMEICTKEERLRASRENVALAVRAFNSIILSLNAEERRLFSASIASLERVYESGFTKLWSGQGILEYFVKPCRMEADKLQRIVDEYKYGVRNIYHHCRVLQDTLAVSIEKKKQYSAEEFESKQETHRAAIKEKLHKIHTAILETMKRLFDFFRKDYAEHARIRVEWHKFVEKIDKEIEDSLKTMVKKSLQEIEKNLSQNKDDDKSNENQLFILEVEAVFTQNENKPTIETRPPVTTLSHKVNHIGKEIIGISQVIPRLEGALAKLVAEDVGDADDKKFVRVQYESPNPDTQMQGTYHEFMTTEQEALMALKRIRDAFETINDKVKDELNKRMQFQSEGGENLWAGSKQFNRMKKWTLDDYDHNIRKHKNLEKSITTTESLEACSFIMLDYNPMKKTLKKQCQFWIENFLTMLHTETIEELDGIYRQFKTDIERLSKPPRQLEHLTEQMGIAARVTAELQQTEKKFDPLEAKFKMLDEPNVNFQVSEDDKKRCEELRPRFEEFKEQLEECKKVLEKHKEQFKADLETDLRAFGSACEQLRKDLLENGPYQSELKPNEAFVKIADYRTKLNLRREKESQLRVGMEVFKIEKPPQNDLKEVSAELELLTKVWELEDKWLRDTDTWKHQPFKTINSEEMADGVDTFRKDVMKLRKDLQNRDVWIKLREEVEVFKRSVPVMDDLLIPAIRARHWEQLFTMLDCEHHDTESAEFCMDKLLELNIEKQSEFVGNLSTAARQELKIENDLEKIKERWENEDLLLERHQGQYWKIASVEEINNFLAEHITMLSSMKMSRFVESFKYKVQQWEQTLSTITDTLEGLLMVQTKWMYLENIFVGSEDISRKLVEETKIFNNVNGQWGTIMNRIAEERNVMRCTRRDGLLDQLNKMMIDLDKIQKSLESFLEDRRRAFPRFYFLSNDDLLEILGHTKEPEKVQPHLRKCFEGLFKLDMKVVRQKKVADGMFSADGERVPFQPAVPIEGLAVEVWLSKVEEKMRDTVQKRLNETTDDLSKNVFRNSLWKRVLPETLQDWIYNHDGQCLITAAQTNWTLFTEKCINEFGEMGGGRRKSSPVYKLYKRWKKLIKKYCNMVRTTQDKFQRNKLVALITIEVHNRDILRVLQMRRVQSTSSFEWSQQLRFYRETENDKQICLIRQTSAVVRYDNEYLGNSGRLVVTGLTDRAYMTLTTALQLHRGGLPQGPAGTGKTETVKDLGKALAKYVMVFNCSDGLDYKSIGRMLSGIAQTGSWSCFDEFNRIEVEVLSVVAQQIFSILSAVSENKKNFIFEGVDIPLNRNCGIFVTMNPGYAGRSELPDNLKALLRPISMMTPDFALICEITLLSQGFSESEVLSKRVAILYELMEKQLSKQDHYDFSLRNIKAVLVQAGNLKRENFPGTEEQLCLKAMMDMNLPKFVKDDVPLFTGMLGDLFPGVEPEDAGLEELKNQVRLELAAKNLEVNEHIGEKVLHLWDTLNTRHGVMVVGQPGSGKTVTWQTLAGSLKRMKDNNIANYEPVRISVVNPKSVTMDELYGSYNKATREWKDGILSDIMRTICRDETPILKWMLFDGPVDTLWIESMNTVLDDNKMLTLNSGERINMTPQVSMVFEVQDLSQASPATVSRCGMVYFNVEDLGWRPFVTTWLRGRQQYEVSINAPKPEVTVKEIETFIDTYMARVLDFRRRECVELFPTVEICALRSFTAMIDALANPDSQPVVPGTQGFSAQAGEQYISNIKLLCVFSMIWSVGATLNEDSRRKFDVIMREVDTTIPSSETSYEYFVDFKTHSWKSWDEHPLLQHPFRPEDEETPYYKLLVPTVDTVRYNYVLSQLVNNRVHTVLVGNTGTGKSLLANGVLQALPADRNMVAQLNFSAQTTAKNVQDIIEGRMEHKSKKMCSPPGGRRMICLIEDLNMPAKEKFGAQPPLELLRQWIDSGGWFDRNTQTRRQVNDMQLVMCMTFGRPDITQRLLSKLNVINVTFPSETIITKIFTQILSFRFSRFPDFLPYCDLLVKATIQVYQKVTTELLPIPSKSHYLYTLRDLSKVFQGIYGCHLEGLDTKEHLFALWVHENFRVFADRMNDLNDKAWFRTLVQDKLATLFQTKWNQIMKARSKGQGAIPENENPIFVDFWDGEFDEMAKYKLVPTTADLKNKVTEALENFNSEPGARAMNLVFFTDALEHMCRIHRIIRQPRGNALLVGLGGSGRNSLTRLATYLAGYTLFSIEIHKKYDIDRFHDDLRTLYRACGGPRRQQKVFYFSDNQIMDITFLEDLNNMLSTGEVPNLFSKDDVQAIKDEVRKDALEAKYKDTTDDIFAFFIDRARRNLHLVVAMSPAQREFRLRLRQFPALVSCTSIDWFVEWPNEALKEVAMVFLEEVDLGDPKPEMQNGIPIPRNEDDGPTRAELVSDMFVFMHDQTSTASRHLKETLKRYNYVTPSSYLDLVRGYCKMLVNKREELEEQRDKLKNGMSKLEETKASVGLMQIELEEQNAMLAKKNVEVDKAVRDIQAKEVTAKEKEAALGLDTTKIEREKANAEAIRADAQADLDKAQPALDEATAALDALRKEEIQEMKSYTSPPEVVQLVMEAVQIALGRKTSWDESKKSLTDSKFLATLKAYDKNNMKDKLLNTLEKYIKKPNFEPKVVSKVSTAASGLCLWIRAIHNYGLVYKEVHPKQVKVENCRKRVRDMEEALERKQRELRDVLDNLKRLQEDLKANQEEKERLARVARETEEKINRAGIIVDGLEGERDRWTESIARYEASIGNLVGDALLASGFLSYSGAFPDEFRRDLLKDWMHNARKLQVPVTRGFDFVDFLVDPTEVRDWQAVGLPGDDFSKENAVVVTRGSRWPLMIDPQGQANKWIKKMEKDNGLKVIDPKQDFMKTVEYAVQFGCPILLQDILEEIDPALDAVVSKAIVRKGSRTMIKMGEQLVEYNENFRMYITTRLANPHYTPETCTKVCLLNFAVKQQGLEEQLLKIVVEEEKPDLERENEKLILSTAAAKKETKRLEDEILNLLTTSQVSLLENVKLVETLQTSKKTAAEIKKQLKEADEMSKKISVSREQFRPCARRASILYFVLSDLGSIDSMYQFALDSYILLFQGSIKNSRTVNVDSIEERVDLLNNWHTTQVYKNTCRGLFEKHKLLFSFHMTAQILRARDDLNLDEYAFFLKGGQILDTSGKPPNPAPQWLAEKSWDNIIELEKLANFHNIQNSFEQAPNDWRQWFLQEKPEDAAMPAEWQTKTSENYLQRMIIVRSLRPDRVIFMVYRFIEETLGQTFVEPPPFNLTDTFDESKNILPLVFVLSPGVDPTNQLNALAERKGRNLKSLALGQGQGPNAVRLIDESAQSGGWVFLANCHLMVSWLQELDKIIENLPNRRPHENFRLWLSSIPTPQFPISILQKAIKMTTEPPTGLKANMLRLYNYVSEEQFQKGSGDRPHLYRPLLFSLCYFHSVLLERRKFGTLGYNVRYDFNYSDFEVSENIIALYVANMPDGDPQNVPFPTINFLIADASYGGRVTDDWDRRCIKTYMAQFMNVKTVSEEGYNLCEAPEFHVPPESPPYQSYKDFCMHLPLTDPPEAFGQHANADIASQISDSMLLLDNMMSVNATLVKGGGGGSGGNKAVQSIEDRCMDILASLEEPSKAAVPQLIDYEGIYEATNEDRGSALNTCLLQEIQRYNVLLKKIHRQRAELRRAVKGEIVMNDELDTIFNALLVGKVPPPWTSAYPSTKPLSSWAVDLVERIEQMKEWGRHTPKTFWLTGFTYPTGFLKSLQQQQARRDKIPIDQYSWEFFVLPSEEKTIVHSAREGAYIRGIHLEGAGWDPETNSLCEPNPMELIVHMPIIHFRPRLRDQIPKLTGSYQCPLYMYPVRTGTRERPSFVVAVDLPGGSSTSSHWVKRGTALLLATSD